MAVFFQFMKRLLEKSPAPGLEEYLLQDVCIVKCQIIQLLLVFFVLIFIIIHQAVLWFLRKQVAIYITAVNGKMVGISEI